MKKAFPIVALLVLGVVLVSPAGGLLGQETVDVVKCPVSGAIMKKAEARITAEYNGQTFYFCSDDCKATFLKDAGNFLTTSYTCPMHPDVRSAKPGKCPECGMNLVARMMQKNLIEQPKKIRSAHQHTDSGCSGHGGC